MHIKKVSFLEKYGARFKIERFEEKIYIYVFDSESSNWYPVTIDDFLEFIDINSKDEIINLLNTTLDVSYFDYDNIEFRNKLFIDDNSENIIPYLVFYEKNKSNLIRIYDINNVLNIEFKDRVYDKEYFSKNFFQLYICLTKLFGISMDGWLIIDPKYVYGIENNKLKLKIGNTLFYVDDLFLKFQKICFNHKRFFNDDYDKLFREVVDYLNEYNKNIKLEKIQPIINYGGNAKVTFTIDNYDRNFHFTEQPFEIEIPYNFDDFIKSHSIKKMLRNKIKKHYKAWDGNFYRFDIEYNGRKETLFL